MDYLKSFGIDEGKINGKYHEEVIYRLVIIYTHIFNDISVFLNKYRLTPAKLNVLMIVKHKGRWAGISQIDLSRSLMVSTSNMTRVLSKLQRDGLVERANAKADQRIKLICITLKGAKLLDKVWPKYTKRLKGLMSGLSAVKKRELSRVFAQWMGLLLIKE